MRLPNVQFHLFLILFIFSLLIPSGIHAFNIDTTGAGPELYFDFNDCSAFELTGSNADYSEFTAVYTEKEFCTGLSVVGANLYRNNPQENKHSCTPGRNGTSAMCVMPSSDCTYDPGNDRSVRFDIQVEPGAGGTGILSGLSFYEKAPDNFDWISGPSGFADNPTLYAIRVLVNGTEIFRQEDIPTSLDWALQEFDFNGLPEFTVEETTVFNFELSAYCLAGNGAQISVWDIEDLRVTGGCEELDGGEIMTMDETTICAGDSIPDPIGVTLTGETGGNSAWVITDTLANILALPAGPPFDLDGAGPGVCLIWHISYFPGIQGVQVGNNVSDLEGCFDLSNSIAVTRLAGSDCEVDCEVEGGDLVGGPFAFCVGDSIPDRIGADQLELIGSAGSAMQWVVTDVDGVILGLPQAIEDVDFDGAGPGTCLVWALSFDGMLTGASVGSNANDIEGCFALSNPINVERTEVAAATLEGGPFAFCVGDGNPDAIDSSEIVVSGITANNTAWVVTDDQGVILGLPPHFSDVDFDGAGAGTCLVWLLSYEGMIDGAEVGNNANTDLMGCYALSNPISVNRNQPEGGTLEGGPFNFCVGDGMPDLLDSTDIILNGNKGANSQWVVTDSDGNILGLPSHFTAVDFDPAGVGTCLVWHLSYDGNLEGAIAGNNAMTDLMGCFSLSNPLEIIRSQPEGGTLEGGPFSFCVGDDIADSIDSSAIVLSGNMGSGSQWVVTDEQGMILGLPPHFSDVDFDGAGPGTCLVWHLSFEGNLEGAEVGNNANTDLSGCFSLSNPISVTRNQPSGGMLEGGPFVFCVGDGEADMIDSTEIVLTGNTGANSQWVITDNQGMILGLPPHFSAVNFDDAGAGVCIIWHLSYDGMLEGAEVGNNANTDITGCYSLSNPLTVIRSQPEGGVLEGGPFEFCVGDGNADMIDSNDIELSGNQGANSQWVVTDASGLILGLPPHFSEVDFDGAGAGECLIWHLSSYGTVEGLAMGNNALTDLVGCYSFSNSISVFRNQPEGGTLEGGPFEFCVGDGNADMIDSMDIVLTGNTGTDFYWVVTDDEGNILGLPPHFSDVDFDGAGAGTCLIWNLSSIGLVDELEVGNNVDDIEGCFALSTPVSVTRLQPDGGTLEGGPFEFCVSDSIPDLIDSSEIVLTGESGSISQWIITDAAGNILGLPLHFTDVDFSGAGPGECLIWHLSYEGLLDGLETGNNAGTDLIGCYSLSNPLTVIRNSGSDCENAPLEMLVINEVNPDGRVEIKNAGTLSIDISSHWLCQFPSYGIIGSMVIDCGGDLILDPGEIVTLQSGISLNSADGELALYDSQSFTSSSAIVDYVQWGSAGHQREAVAVSAGIWTAGDFVPAFASTNVIEYDGMGDMSTDWSEDLPSPCMENSIGWDPRENLSYTLYPNPASNNLTIELNNSEFSAGDLVISNNTGEIVLTGSWDAEGGNGINLDVTDLDPGIYFIRLQSGKRVSVKRFVKM